METVRHSPNWSHMTMQWNGSLHNMVYYGMVVGSPVSHRDE